MLKISQLEDKQKDINYIQPIEDTQKVNFVMQRFNKMKENRTIVDKDWDKYQTMIDAIFVPYPDNRSSSVVPLASSMIELFVAETIKLETEFKFRGETQEYKTQAKALEYVWKYDWRRNNRKKVFNEAEYITAGFGTSVIYTGFESYSKTQKDFIITDDLGYSWQDKVIKKDEIIVKNIDLRNFYLDNQAISCIEEASDCILIQRMSFDKFMNFKNSALYKNVDKVRPINYENDYDSYIIQEQTSKDGRFVKLMHYWNIEKDAYMVIANNILIREHPVISTINGEKALPFTIRNLGKKNFSVYGRGFCEPLFMFNKELNDIRELLMDGIRRSNSQVLAIGNGLNFNGRNFSYDNEILLFDGNLANNFQQISGNPPNQAIFNHLLQIYKDIAVFIGIDIQNILGEPQQTAFQSELQREASQKRVNVRLTNRDLAYERFANLHKDNLQTYFPRKTAEGLYPVIEIEGEEMMNNKFRKKKGNSVFEVTPELLRGDFYIDVYTNTNAPTINAVDRAQKLELLQTIGQITEGYMIAKQGGVDLETIIPLKQTIKDLADDYNITTVQEANDDVKEAKMKLYNEIKNMMGPVDGNQPLPPGMEQLPPNMAQGNI